MIRKVKQKIRDYLTAKYDARYLEELECQVMSYDTWINQQEDALKEDEIDIIWDLRKEEQTFVILAEDEKRVSKTAIEKIASVFEKYPQVEVVYTDEDEWNHNESVRMNPWFKPDYSPDTLLSYFYFGNLVAVRKEILLKAAKTVFQSQEKFLNFGKQKTVYSYLEIVSAPGEPQNYKKRLYQLILEVCSRLKREQIYHLRKVLYSSHNISYWGFEEEYKNLRDSYKKSREREVVEGVSIVIPSKDNPKILERCLKSVIHWTKDISYELIVVDNGSTQENKEAIRNMQKQYNFSYFYEAMEFNFSKMCNIGAGQAKYNLLLFLNDDCEVRSSKWLSHMADFASVKETGAVGVKLYYPESKRIQHCGIYNIHLGPVHKLQFKEDVRSYYDRRNLDTRNVLAVTAACLMIRKSIFEEIKGFDENLQVAFNDVDLCYRIYEAGYNNVIDNEIHLWHHESLSRGGDESPMKLKRLMGEKQKLYEKHVSLWEDDPYYHPAMTSDILDTGYSFDYEYPKHKHLAVEHPLRISKLPEGIREDACVAPMVEYAGDLKGWFLEDDLVAKIEKTMSTNRAAYLQGNVVILGSDNACFEKKLILRHESSGSLYQISPEWYYRPDVFANLQDQTNVALSGFACLIHMNEMPVGRYEVGILVTDKISKQSLLRVTTRSVENK